MEDLTKHYLISGRVQGVGYRAFTHRIAETMNLKGWVRNLEDGRVEIVAQGPLPMLLAFESRLRIGPPHGHVETMIAGEWKPLTGVEDFAVRKDGDKPCSAP